MACRATPNFVQSHDETVKLVASPLAGIEKFDTDSHHVLVATAGRSIQWNQLATICDIATASADPKSFNGSLVTDGRWSEPIRKRRVEFEKMITKAVATDTSPEELQRLAWKLLWRLHVRGFAVQSPDEADRTAAATTLDRIAATNAGGVTVRDRLEVESSNGARAAVRGTPSRHTCASNDSCFR